MPFLYPSLAHHRFSAQSIASSSRSLTRSKRAVRPSNVRHTSGLADQRQHSTHLDPEPDSYSSTPFTDRCDLTLHAGHGGHGCISFLREKYIENGPANGGDGGTGGSIYIQAVKGETSLHRLSRTSILRATRGRNGQGKSKGGERGNDLLIKVPLGTVVREIDRHDPMVEADHEYRMSRRRGADARNDRNDANATDQSGHWRRDKWLLYPGMLPSAYTTVEFPALPRPRRSNLTMAQPAAPLRLDLDQHMERPMLLAAGAVGGLGNPHFVTKNITRPKFATKGEHGMKMQIHLELKILADVGLVGLPNAGKSTLLRSVSKSRTRVGDWAFTTLQPSIGTVIVDNYRGRPTISSDVVKHKDVRTSFTIADIPGLVKGAHLDMGLGLDFLRHVERASILAFVIDLSSGSAVDTLTALWHEIVQYQTIRDKTLNRDSERRLEQRQQLAALHATDQAHDDANLLDDTSDEAHMLSSPSHQNNSQSSGAVSQPITSKRWFVIATKADLLETQENYGALQKYVQDIASGHIPHPSGVQNAWCKDICTVPVSAINGQGVQAIPQVIMNMLD